MAEALEVAVSLISLIQTSNLLIHGLECYMEEIPDYASDFQQVFEEVSSLRDLLVRLEVFLQEDEIGDKFGGKDDPIEGCRLVISKLQQECFRVVEKTRLSLNQASTPRITDLKPNEPATGMVKHKRSTLSRHSYKFRAPFKVEKINALLTELSRYNATIKMAMPDEFRLERHHQPAWGSLANLASEDMDSIMGNGSGSGDTATHRRPGDLEVELNKLVQDATLSSADRFTKTRRPQYKPSNESAAQRSRPAEPVPALAPKGDDIAIGMWSKCDAQAPGEVQAPGDVCDGSDISDLESIWSEAPSLTSSISPSGEVSGNAVVLLKGLFLQDDELKDLYLIAFFRVGPERLQRNLRRLLIRYGRALHNEAVETLQVRAARLVRHSSLRVAAEIREAIVIKSVTGSTNFSNGRQRLNEYIEDLKCDAEHEDDFPNSDDESEDNRETSALETLEAVEDFMTSAKAFGQFRNELKRWLKVDARPCVTPGDLLTTELTPSNPGQNQKRENAPRRVAWVDSMVRKLKELQNLASESIQPRVPRGDVRISWTCRCGKRLRIQVPKNRQAAGLAFAQRASGSSDVSGITVRSSNVDGSSLNSSSTDLPQGDIVFQSSHTSSESVSTAPSFDDQRPPGPFIPAGTKKYILLCINTGVRLIGLENVDVTDADHDEEIFKRLRIAYQKRRGRRFLNPFIKPKTMHYVKFPLLHLQKSGDCVGNYTTNSIPSKEQVFRQEYAFSPCPPAHGDVPIPPDIFMHAFLDPMDHLGTIATVSLPKKLQCQLRWVSSIHNVHNLPIGWGCYIIEGVHWSLAASYTSIIALAVTILTVCWSATTGDVQGGTGIGQYCVAVLAVLSSAILLSSNAE
ncbi:Fc.00g080480.m01.CDS01 [Cosmosporella sp. VM-42]